MNTIEGTPFCLPACRPEPSFTDFAFYIGCTISICVGHLSKFGAACVQQCRNDKWLKQLRCDGVRLWRRKVRPSPPLSCMMVCMICSTPQTSRHQLEICKSDDPGCLFFATCVAFVRELWGRRSRSTESIFDSNTMDDSMADYRTCHDLSGCHESGIHDDCISRFQKIVVHNQVCCVMQLRPYWWTSKRRGASHYTRDVHSRITTCHQCAQLGTRAETLTACSSCTNIDDSSGLPAIDLVIVMLSCRLSVRGGVGIFRPYGVPLRSPSCLIGQVSGSWFSDWSLQGRKGSSLASSTCGLRDDRSIQKLRQSGPYCCLVI